MNTFFCCFQLYEYDDINFEFTVDFNVILLRDCSKIMVKSAANPEK